MSFPRAEVKRFNEQQGCAPPPGHYNMPELKPGSGVVTFETGGQRFKQDDDSQQSAELAEQLSAQFSVPSQPSTTKKRLNYNLPVTNVKSKSGSNKSTPLPSPSMSKKEKQAYEQEIRRLLQQVNEQDKKLQSKIQDLQKLEGKLNILTKDKSSLVAQVAASERKVMDIARKNSILQAQKTSQNDRQQKKDDLEAELKKTKQKLDTAKQELDKCRSLLVALQSDLHAARSTITALQQSNKVLTQLNKEVQEHSDDVANQVTKLQDLADTLRSEKLVTEEELAVATKKLQMVDQEFTELLTKKVHEIEGRITEKQKDFNQHLETMEKKVKDSEIQVDELQQTISKLENDKMLLSDDKNELSSKFAQIYDDHAQCTSSLSDYEKRLQEAEKTLHETEQAKSQLQEKVTHMCEEIARVNTERNAKDESWAKKVQTLQKNLDANEAKTNDLETRLEDVTSEKVELKTKVDDVLGHNENLTQELAQAKAGSEGYSTEISSVRHALEEAKKRCSEMQNELNKTKNDIRNMEEGETILSKNFANMKKEVAEYKEQLVLSEAKADALETQLMKSNKVAQDASEQGDVADQKTAKLEHALKEKENDYQAKLNEFTRRLLETQKKLNGKQEQVQSLTKAREDATEKMRAMKKSTDQQMQRLADADRVAEENSSLLKRVKSLEDELSLAKMEEGNKSELNTELEKWRNLYVNLQEKVKPFQGQIDAYCVEKKALLSENSAAHAEMQELGKKYAELLGHQNQKQKIRHVVKIKEENIGLKQELAKLRTQVAKLQKQVLSDRAPKFNPAEAFQQKKENSAPFSNNN